MQYSLLLLGMESHACISFNDDDERQKQHDNNKMKCDNEAVALLLPEDIKRIILPEDLIMPEPMRTRLLSGCTLWDAVVEHHHEINLHHDYSTTSLQVAQEIALDFFSSALVACPLTSTAINGSVIRKAHSVIQTWPNYVTASVQVRRAVACAKVGLERHYSDVDDVTKETESLPAKPRNVEVARSRLAQEDLVRIWQRLTGGRNRLVEEATILKELAKLMVWETDAKKCAALWKEFFPRLFEGSELKKWIAETYHHKKLMEDFHSILKKQDENCYLLTDEIVSNHDNDKYHPYQLLGYTLKWYYGIEDKLF